MSCSQTNPSVDRQTALSLYIYVSIAPAGSAAHLARGKYSCRLFVNASCLQQTEKAKHYRKLEKLLVSVSSYLFLHGGNEQFQPLNKRFFFRCHYGGVDI